MNVLNISTLLARDHMIIPNNFYTRYKSLNKKTLLLAILLYNYFCTNKNSIVYIPVNEICEYLRSTIGSVLYSLRKLQKYNILNIIKIDEEFIEISYLN